MDDVYLIASQRLSLGQTVALATIVRSHGSTPRKAGAKLVLTSDQKTHGSIGGGCIEAAVIGVCQELIRTGGRRLMRFDLSDQDAADAGLICGGNLMVWIEAIKAGSTA